MKTKTILKTGSAIIFCDEAELNIEPIETTNDIPLQVRKLKISGFMRGSFNKRIKNRQLTTFHLTNGVDNSKFKGCAYSINVSGRTHSRHIEMEVFIR